MRKLLYFKVVNALILLCILLSLMSGSVFLCRISVFLILLLCLIVGSFERYIVNPINIFVLTPFSLLIYVNIGDAYMVNIKYQTWMIAIINMYAFIIAFIKSPVYTNINFCIGNPNIKSLQYQSIVFYLISLTGLFIPQIASIAWIFGIASIVCALKTKKRVMFIFVLLIFLFTAFGITSKSTMLTYCITFIICLEKYFINNERQRKWVRWALGVSVVFMIFTFSFANKGRETHSSEDSLELYSRRGVDWNYSAGLFMPYMYITNGWTNLQYAMETQDKRTHGLWSIKPLLGYLQVEDNFKKEYSLVSYSSLNTFAYMTYGFKDFGYFLSILMSLFLGFFVKRVYSRYVISRSPYDVASFILVSQATLEMFFSNHFFTQSYPFTVVILMAIVKLYMQKKDLKNIELE